MATQAKRLMDESFIDFYDEQLVGHADLVYRFGFGLTLSLDAGAQLVKRTFQQVASSLDSTQVKGDVNVKALLLSAAWKIFLEGRGKKPGPTATSLTLAKSVTKYMNSINLEARAAVLVVDVGGLSVAESTLVLGWSEKEVRSHLATGRRALVDASFEA